MDRTRELYNFISTYIEERELPNSRTALRTARELMEGIVRTSTGRVCSASPSLSTAFLSPSS